MMQYVNAFRRLMRGVYAVKSTADADKVMKEYEAVSEDLAEKVWILDAMLLFAPFLPLIPERLPYVLCNWFQTFLVAEKIFELQPFGNLAWPIVLMPLSIRILFWLLVEGK